MTAKTITAITLAVGTMFIAASADAGTKKHDHGRNYHGHDHGHHYNYDRGHYGFHAWGHDTYRSCSYYKKKARYTDSSYWWKKYKRCVVRYY